MSSQCKGTTKSGTPCKMTIVLPNGYCRLHQEQYVVEIKEDAKEAEMESIKVENEAAKKSIPEGKTANTASNVGNSMPYVRYSGSSKRWYIVPVLVMAFFWILSKLMKKKKNSVRSF